MSSRICCCHNQNSRYLSVPYFYCLCGATKNGYIVNQSLESLVAEEDNLTISISADNRSMSVDELQGSTRRQSVGDPTIDHSTTSTMYHDAKAKSQTSLLTALKDTSIDSNLTSIQMEDSRPVSDNKTKYFPKGLIGQGKVTLSKTSPAGQHYTKHIGATPESSVSKLQKYTKLIKSASSIDLFDSDLQRTFKDSDDNVAIDSVDGPGNSMLASSADCKDQAIKWNPSIVDIKETEVMLQSLDDHIKEKRDQINKYMSHKEEMVDQLISNFNLTSNDKLSKKNRREFESKNKSAEKLLEKTQIELEQLEYKRLIVSQEGIPWGVMPADHVKKISRRKNKIKDDTALKEGPETITSFMKGHSSMSASAENISDWGHKKTKDTSFFSPLFFKSGSEKSKSKGTDKKYMTLDNSVKPSNEVSLVNLSKSINLISNVKKPSSVGGLSYDDKGNQNQGSKSNSLSSHAGKDHIINYVDNQDSPRHQSLSGISGDDQQKADSNSRLQSLQEDMSLIRKEIHEVRSECNRFHGMASSLKLDMETDSELNSQKMQNAIERIDKLERTQELLRQEYQIEFYSWKNEFRSLEEMLNYRLTATKRDLQDKIEACSNSISLIEKRTEHLPFMSNRSGRSDMKIITDHLCNLVVSLIAFFMLLISSCLHLFIKVLNLGATISQNRVAFLFSITIAVVVGVMSMKWSLFSRMLAGLAAPDNPPL